MSVLSEHPSTVSSPVLQMGLGFTEEGNSQIASVVFKFLKEKLNIPGDRGYMYALQWARSASECSFASSAVTSLTRVPIGSGKPHHGYKLSCSR